MVPRLLLNVCIATPFYQLPAYHVYSFLRNSLYLIRTFFAAFCAVTKTPWRCTAVMASYLTLPSRLADVAVALKLTQQKMSGAEKIDLILCNSRHATI